MGNRDLTPEEYRICEQQAIISSFMDVTPVEKPKAIFVLAQPGAGKTGLTGLIKREFDSKVMEPILHIDPDRISVFHKYYAEIIRENPRETYRHFQKFTGPALKAINKMAIDKGVNILTEGTFRDKAGYLGILENLMSHNYEIELNFMAVGNIESMLSAMERFYQMADLGLPLRNVEKIFHDKAYFGMLDTLRTVEERGLFSTIRIYTRGREEREPNLVYSRDGNNYYQSATEMLQIIREKEQRRMLQNPENMQSRVDKLKAKMEKNGNEFNQREQLEQIEAEIAALLQAQRDGREEKTEI